jgi:hypothetical protein
VGIGGGDQVYCDEVLSLPELQAWLQLDERSAFQQMYSEPYSEEMGAAVLHFYLEAYLQQYSNPQYSACLAAIPMIQQW